MSVNDVNVVMAQNFLPGVTNRNTGVSRREIKFSIRRRDNHALGVTLGSIGDDVVAWLLAYLGTPLTM